MIEKAKSIEFVEHHLGPLLPYLQDESVVELVANRFGEIGLEQINQTGFEFVPITELDEKFWLVLFQILAGLAGKVFDRQNPRVSEQIPGDGHRFEGVLGPCTDSGLHVAIRLKRKYKLTFEDFGLNQEQIQTIRSCIMQEKPILISGGTSSGKSTFLDLMMKEIPPTKRIICVEDTKELDILHHNVARYTLSNQSGQEIVTWPYVIDSCMRLRPDIIIAGELTIKNTFEFISLRNTGHGGFMTTVHANSPKLAIE